MKIRWGPSVKQCTIKTKSEHECSVLKDELDLTLLSRSAYVFTGQINKVRNGEMSISSQPNN